MSQPVNLLFLATEDWYFAGHRLGLARAAVNAGHTVSVATRVRSHARAISAADIRLIRFPWSRGSFAPGNLVREVRGLHRLINDERPDIIHCVSLRTIVAACAAVTGGERMLLAFTGLGYLFVGNAAWKRLARRIVATILRRAARSNHVVFLFENAEDRDTIMALVGEVPGRASVNPGSGVDTARFSPVPEPEDKTVTIGCTARMLRIKGITDLIAASRILDERGVTHRVALAGPIDPDNVSGITSEELARLCAGTSCEWLGNMDDVASFWAQAHVAVLASWGGEGVPLGLAEGGACGRPMVATDVPGCRDLVKPHRTGFIVPPRDPPALAEALEKLCRDAELREVLGAQAATHVSEKFSSKKVNARTLAIYGAMMRETIN